MTPLLASNGAKGFHPVSPLIKHTESGFGNDFFLPPLPKNERPHFMSDITYVPFKDRVLCSINEAAEATGTSRSKIYEWLRTGTLRAVRLDGRTKVVVASLLELAKRGAA
jgi:excisionase family DNA binding protein